MYKPKLFDTSTSLEDFIRRYQPSNWCEPIQSCCAVPIFLDKEYEQVKQGNYESYYRPLTWFEKEAIVEFFKQLKEQEEI
jgi:hypothetical protein